MTTGQIITIDPEVKGLIPRLTAEEREILEKSIVNEGCRDALVVWSADGILLDGHNRYEICKRKSIEYQVIYRHFGSRDDAKAWVIRNQFGRRNLSSMQRAELALQLEPLIAKKAKENQIAGGARSVGAGKVVRQNSDKPLDTKREVAKIAGVSHDTLHKAKVILSEASEDTKAKVRSWERSINSAYRDIRPRGKRNRRPDFSKISPRAATPKLAHSSRGLPIPVSLPQDPRLAAEVLLEVLGVEFLQRLSTAIMEVLSD